MHFANMLEKKFPDAKLTESYSGALFIANEGGFANRQIQ